MSFTKTMQLRRHQFATRDTRPSMTDQTAANETRIHTIVKRATTSGQVNINPKEAQYLDWTEIPDSLVEMIKFARNAKQLRSKLPKELQKMTDAQLNNLTYEQLKAILEPPKPKEEAKTEETKTDEKAPQ